MVAYSTTIDISVYPDVNPFYLDPPLFNLVPEPKDSGQYDTPELLQAALVIAERTDVNVFSGMYGTNPLHVVDRYLTPSFRKLREYQKPPPLPETSLPSDARFLEQLNPTGNSAVFRLHAGGKDLLLKVVCDFSLVEFVLFNKYCSFQTGRELEEKTRIWNLTRSLQTLVYTSDRSVTPMPIFFTTACVLRV